VWSETSDVLEPVLRNQMIPLIIDSRVVLFRNVLTPGHSVRIRVRVRGSIYFGGGVKIFRDTGIQQTTLDGVIARAKLAQVPRCVVKSR